MPILREVVDSDLIEPRMPDHGVQDHWDILYSLIVLKSTGRL